MRRLDDHLNPHELTKLLHPETMRENERPDAGVEQHLRECDGCSELLAMLKVCAQASRREGSSVTKDCPSMDVWLEFTEGLRPDDAESLLEHAATCPACAEELKVAMMLMAEIETDEMTEELASATPSWQSAMGRTLAELSSQPERPELSLQPMPPMVVQRTEQPERATQNLIPWKTRRVWGVPLYGAMAACLALIAITITGLWFHGYNSEASLLARAYNKQRVTELRIPGGRDVPVESFTRGDQPDDVPAELDSLRARVKTNLDAAPESPYWHQMRGRVNLLEGHPEKALVDLKLALTEAGKAHLEQPGLLGDLGDAQFEQGEKSGNPNDYREAAEFYSQQLQQHQGDLAVLYFNLALCWERIGTYPNAVINYRLALAAEKDPAWRKRIQEKIDKLTAKSSTATTDGYEAAMSTAVEKLLPQWNQSAEARATLQNTAALGRSHRDRWLSDWIAADHNATSEEADRSLAAALAAAHGGRYEELLADTQHALALYARLHKGPGNARARQLEVYAFQRLGHARECRDSATALAADHALTAYPGILTQLLLDEGACEGRLEDYNSSELHFRQAQVVSATANLPYANLSALESEAEVLAIGGNASSAWRRDAAGVRECDRLRCGGSEYPLLYNMVGIAQELGEDHVAEALMRTAVDCAALSGNPVKHAYAVETLATLEGKVGDYDDAARDFAQAYDIARGAGGRITPIYQALWQTDQARVLSRRGNPTAALQLLASSRPVLLASDYAPGRIGAYSQQALAELASGRTNEALRNAQLAVAEAERSLGSVQTTPGKEQWARENADVYADLVNVYLQRGDNTAALAMWERYRTAPYQGRTMTTPTAAAAPADEVLVIARVKDNYIGWLARTRPLTAERTVVLGNRRQLQSLATTFYRLCTDRASNMQDLHALGMGLYHSLLGPLDAHAESRRHLWIDLDPSLQAVPLGALTVTSQDWLAERAQITLLAPWWSLAVPGTLIEPSLDPALHMLVLNGFSGAEGSRSEASEVARQFAASTLMVGSETTQIAVLRALAATELFHFSGHAHAGEGAQLVVAPRSTQDADSGLTPQTLGSLRLSACRLAVLAACNTNSADPDQIERLPDLRNALLQAGARTVIASNWDVDNGSTRALMLAFYKEARPGASPSLALEAAQRSISSTAAWQHPFYWAAFQSFTQ